MPLLVGNHEEIFFEALRSPEAIGKWLELGGAATLKSYGWVKGGPRRTLEGWIPESHRRFLAGCRNYYETEPTCSFMEVTCRIAR
jgi:serine/threonine protein phosphatase 1